MKSSKYKNIVYCSNRKCPYTECLRHNTNTPWNVLIMRDNFQLNKNLECKYKII